MGDAGVQGHWPVPILWAPSLCLSSYNRLHFIFLVDFPKDSTINYMVNSYQGDMAFVTETDEVSYPVVLPKPSLFTTKPSCPVTVNTLKGSQDKVSRSSICN